MNHWQHDLMPEQYRQRVLDEVEQIRLEKLAMKSQVYRPRFYERTMFNFANWMIAKGNQLRKRYEIPTVNCSDCPNGIFAQ